MRSVLLASVVLAAGGVVSAQATNINWNFGDHVGLLGATQTFTGTLGDLLDARGFDLGDVGTALFSKVTSGDPTETGLGLNNDPSGNDEISFGHGFIQLNVDTAISENVSGFNFVMGSDTQGETWAVYGSNNAHPFQFTLLSSGADEGVDHPLAAGWDNYNFFYTGAAPGLCGSGCNGNVLIESFAGVTQAAVPEPSTWAMMGAGFGLLGLVGYGRRKQARFAI